MNVEVPQSLIAQLLAYVDRSEEGFCGEYHDSSWPNCDDDDHDKGRYLLNALRHLSENAATT